MADEETPVPVEGEEALPPEDEMPAAPEDQIAPVAEDEMPVADEEEIQAAPEELEEIPIEEAPLEEAPEELPTEEPLEPSAPPAELEEVVEPEPVIQAEPEPEPIVELVPEPILKKSPSPPVVTNAYDPSRINPDNPFRAPASSVVFTPSPDLVPRPPPPVVEARPPTIFGRVPERCVTFCIDTSGSMFNSLHVVKDHLMEVLHSLAARDTKPMFNLIEFNSQVTQWADKLVQCTPETVAVADKWVGNLSAKTGTNTQDALLAALADPDCEAIYLVSDGLPDQYQEDVLDSVVGVCGRRRIHCIYLTGETTDEAATEFMEDLAVETFGSFHIVTLTTHGCVERITPIYRSDHSHEGLVYTVNNTLRANHKICNVATTLQTSPNKILSMPHRGGAPLIQTAVAPPNAYPPDVKTCSVSSTLQINPDEILAMPQRAAALAYPSPYLVPPAMYTTLPHRYYYPHYWSRYRPAKAWLAAQDKLGEPMSDLSPSAGSLMIGKKVIARRIEDGYFYRAAVQSQVSLNIMISCSQF